MAGKYPHVSWNVRFKSWKRLQTALAELTADSEMGIQVPEKLLEGIVKNIGLIVQAALKIVESFGEIFR